MTPHEINILCERLIAYRDGQTNRADRDLLADVCNALDSFAKQTREVRAAAANAREVLANNIIARTQRPPETLSSPKEQD